MSEGYHGGMPDAPSSVPSAPASPASPASYDAWYHAPRGAWIASSEWRLLGRLLGARPGQTVLDAGAGTGHFTARLAEAGLLVTALDPDPAALAFARARGRGTAWVRGDAAALPFPDGAFDHAVAMLSLCFVAEPGAALAELLRVARRGVVLGLLNRRSLLCRVRRGRGGYRGARWDAPADARRWAAALGARAACRSAVFLPGGGPAARAAERFIPTVLPWGGFLAVRVVREET
jgi:SAM-dependent methyltransferase